MSSDELSPEATNMFSDTDSLTHLVSEMYVKPV